MGSKILENINSIFDFLNANQRFFKKIKVTKIFKNKSNKDLKKTKDDKISRKINGSKIRN